MKLGLGLGFSRGTGAWLPSHLLALDFDDSKYRVRDEYTTNILDVATYTRAGAKSELNSTGSITSYAANVPGITDEGYWSRQAFTNLLVRSQEFDNAAWAKSETTISANAATGPDGVVTADKVIPSAVSGFHSVAQGASVSESTTYSKTFYAKADGYGWLALNLSHSGVADYFAYFDVANGVLGSKDAAVTSSIESVAGGYYRCTISKTTVAGQTTLSCQAFIANADPGTGGVPAAFAGDGSSGILISQAQLLAGNLPDGGPIIVTTGSAATVAEDNLPVDLPAALTDQDMLIWARFKVATSAYGQYALMLDTGVIDNSIILYDGGSSNARAAVIVGGVSSDVVVGAFTAGQDATIALRRIGTQWSGAVYKDGALGAWANVSTSFPTGIANARIGRGITGSVLNGIIAAADIVPGTFDTDAKVIAAIGAL